MRDCPHSLAIRVQNSPVLPRLPESDRPVSGVLGCSFQKNPVLTTDWEIGYFTKRKTGLFGALWIDDLRLPKVQGVGAGIA
jgi:hypothetical protein